MRMRFERWMLGPLMGVAIGLALLAWTQRDGNGQPAPERGSAPPPRPALPAAPSAPPPHTPVSKDDLTLNVQIERLLATHDPADALRAYWLIADCARLCGPMTERERQARLDYLAIALEAGVPGAATAFVDAGPFGDPSALQTRPGDPLVVEWKATARAQLARAADSGTDFGALNVWATDNQIGSDITGKNQAVAYPYLLARVYAQDSDMMSALAAGLSPEQRAAGLAAARRIATLAKEARQRARGTGFMTARPAPPGAALSPQRRSLGS